MCRYFKAEIKENTVLNSYFSLLTLVPLSQTKAPAPGQFYMLQPGNSYDPLLKRPFSVFNVENNSLQFLFRIRGKATQALADRKKGDILQVIGPLGQGYPEPEGEFIAVAGGIGIASLFPLLERFKGRAHLYYGARNKDELIMVNEAKALAKDTVITTDDGSMGPKGFITDYLKVLLDSGKHPLTLYACGPHPMLKELARVVAGRGLKCYVSMEEHMACGMGACLGCIVKTKSGQQRVCKEGPVFDMEDIVW